MRQLIYYWYGNIVLNSTISTWEIINDEAILIDFSVVKNDVYANLQDFLPTEKMYYPVELHKSKIALPCLKCWIVYNVDSRGYLSFDFLADFCSIPFRVSDTGLVVNLVGNRLNVYNVLKKGGLESSTDLSHLSNLSQILFDPNKIINVFGSNVLMRIEGNYILFDIFSCDYQNLSASICSTSEHCCFGVPQDDDQDNLLILRRSNLIVYSIRKRFIVQSIGLFDCSPQISFERPIFNPYRIENATYFSYHTGTTSEMFLVQKDMKENIYCVSKYTGDNPNKRTDEVKAKIIQKVIIKDGGFCGQVLYNCDFQKMKRQRQVIVHSSSNLVVELVNILVDYEFHVERYL